eukprot:TRINITY_DN66427_c8_g1_i1.p1 TRINITY_DN66427_c8_g1~~TRINITY_DN66427_c8_g1_i1.p1  ORF type:complete len:126 (+),score=19.60 TRINITY_DN66427_c8_g1_i1:101-478(+)
MAGGHPHQENPGRLDNTITQSDTGADGPTKSTPTTLTKAQFAFQNDNKYTCGPVEFSVFWEQPDANGVCLFGEGGYLSKPTLVYLYYNPAGFFECDTDGRNALRFDGITELKNWTGTPAPSTHEL